MSFIIITRNPGNNKLLVITNEPGEDSPAEFINVIHANIAANDIPICRAWGHEVIEVTC